MSPSDTTTDKREDVRKNVFYDCHITMGTERYSCDVLNISAGGARLRLDGNSNLGGEAVLHVDDYGNFAGTLVWNEDNTFGFKFDQKPENGKDMAMAMAIFGQL